MKKIIIALADEGLNKRFQEFFQKEDFYVNTTTSGKKALEMIINEPPDVVLADVALRDLTAFDILKQTRKYEAIQNVPLIVFSRTGAKNHFDEAIANEAKDFVVGLSEPPEKVVLKVKSHLGIQKTYILNVTSDDDATEIIKDLGYKNREKCKNCGANISLHLLRNLALGKDIFKISVLCTKCNFKHSIKTEEE